jgi:rhodanese-related sulfurtransferase
LIPLPELESRVNEVKGKSNVIVNCFTGLRSKVAFSILAKHGVEAKFFADNFKDFKSKGYKVVDFNE